MGKKFCEKCGMKFPCFEHVEGKGLLLGQEYWFILCPGEHKLWVELYLYSQEFRDRQLMTAMLDASVQAGDHEKAKDSAAALIKVRQRVFEFAKKWVEERIVEREKIRAMIEEERKREREEKP